MRLAEHTATHCTGNSWADTIVWLALITLFGFGTWATTR